MQIPTFVHRLRQPIYWCSMNCFHASIHAHTHQHVHRAMYNLMFFFYDKLVVHMCIYTFTVACMYSLHACSCIHSMYSVHASANISASSTTTDQCSMSCFHASIHAHTHHHVHRTLYTLIFFLLWQTCSTHVHVYFHHCLHVFTAWLFIYSLHVFGSCKYQHMCIVYDNQSTDVPWIVSMQVFMRILIIMCTEHCTL